MTAAPCAPLCVSVQLFLKSFLLAHRAVSSQAIYPDMSGRQAGVGCTLPAENGLVHAGGELLSLTRHCPSSAPPPPLPLLPAHSCGGKGGWMGATGWVKRQVEFRQSGRMSSSACSGWHGKRPAYHCCHAQHANAQHSAAQHHCCSQGRCSTAQMAVSSGGSTATAWLCVCSHHEQASCCVPQLRTRGSPLSAARSRASLGRRSPSGRLSLQIRGRGDSADEVKRKAGRHADCSCLNRPGCHIEHCTACSQRRPSRTLRQALLRLHQRLTQALGLRLPTLGRPPLRL